MHATTIKPRRPDLARVIAYLSTFLLVFLFLAGIWYERFLGGGSIFRRTLDPPGIVREVRQLNRLVTVTYSIQKVIGMKEDYRPFGSESLLLMVQGRVLAGIDLSNFNQYDVVQPKHGAVVIKLPLPRITEAFLDEGQTRVWDRHITWWTPWISPDPSLEHKARVQALDEIRSQALAMGILRDARRNAEEDIRGLLRIFGIGAVTFLSS